MSQDQRQEMLEAQHADYRAIYERMHAAYIPIECAFGTLVCILARVRQAKTNVQFGT